MKKIALFSLLALGLMTLATQVNYQSPVALSFSPDVPPPDCAPNNCFGVAKQ
jgi:hypothetical protein